MKLQSVRIKSNDFPEDQKQLAESLGGILNPFIDKLVIGFNKNFTVDDNLPFEFKILDTRVDDSGTPELNASLTTNLRNLKGYICINMTVLDRGDSGFAEFLGTENDDTLITESGDNIGLTTPGLFPIAAPFLVTETIGSMSYIRHIAGLRPGVNYRLILLGIS
jgi:hypothetical protein